MMADIRSISEAPAASAGRSRHIPFLPEIALLAIGIAAYYLFPEDLALLTRIAITALLVLSLSLVLGQAGIATLGHAVFMGVGAYAAGLFAMHFNSDPLLGLAVGALAGGVFALFSGSLLLRTHGLTFLMLTVAVSQILYEVANQASWLTGGDDGLSGFKTSPLFGYFRFDLFSRTAFLYSLGVLVISYFVIRKIVESPFGMTIRGIRSDHTRMAALGNNVYRQLLVTFTIGGLFAGVAGALAAQTSHVVGLSTLSFHTSGEALVMLIVGGSRRLPGAILGTVIFLLVQHVASAINPYHWLFLIGALLILCVLALPGGLMGLVDSLWERMTDRRASNG